MSHGAEFLVMAMDKTHLVISNPVEDKAGCYKRGDVVVVEPDFNVWGRLERLPTFFVIKVPMLSVEYALKYIESEVDNTDPGKPVVETRRKYRILIDSAPFKNELNNTGVVVLTWNALRAYIENKKTEVTE
jgi:hypothetical protein